MNYLEIVLKGYFNDNNRKFLEKYFLREYKKAEKVDFFEADEFFNGCLEVIASWEKHLQDNVNERKKELTFMLINAKNGTLSFADLENKTIEHKRLETIEYCEQELKDIRPDGIGSLSFTVNLFSLTKGSIAYHLAYNEILQIKLSISKAFQQTHFNIETLSNQPIVKQKSKLTINQIALKYVYESLQITRENGNEIAKQYGHNSGEKLFQRFTYYSSLANRKGIPNSCTPKKLDNKIKLIESVIELLPKVRQDRAKDEVLLLKTIYDTEYQ